MTEITFGMLSLTGYRICNIFSVLAVYFALYTMARCITTRKVQLTLFSAAAFITELLVYQAGTDLMMKNPERPAKATTLIMKDFPLFSVAFIISSFALLTLLILIVCIRKERLEIGNNTVKEAIDLLPQGLCYYNDSGIPSLVNTVMTELSYRVTGTAVLNGKTFEEAVFGDVQGEKNNVIVTSGEKSYCFNRSVMKSKKTGWLNVITATDVTELDYYEKELERKNSELIEINKRVRELGDTIVETTRQKEIFLNKVAIHNNLGHLIMTTANSLESGDCDRAELLKLWRKTVGNYTDVSPEQEKDKYVVMNKVASDVGLKMTITGTLPEDKPSKDAVVSAMHQCITNTVCHAGGNELYIACVTENGTVRVTFTNNGAVPDGEIKEGGGLSEVRRITAAAGGSMTVYSRPQFALVLELPADGNI